MIYTFRFPPQDFKLKPGDQPRRAGSLEPAGEVVAIYEDAHTIDLNLGSSRSPIAPGTALIPSCPVGDRPLLVRYCTPLHSLPFFPSRFPSSSFLFFFFFF